MTEIVPATAAGAVPAMATAATAAARLPPELASMAAGTILRATVIGREPGGHTILRTQYGALSIKTPAVLPPGGTVTLQLRQTGAHLQVVILSVDGGTSPEPAAVLRPHMPVLPQPTATVGLPDDSLLMLTGKWEALAAALVRLDQSAAHRLSGLVPRPGADLAARIAQLIEALRGGDIAAWVGRDTVHAIAAAAGEALAGRLGEDFARLGRLAAADPGEWRFLPIPLFHGGALGQLRLFTRHRQPAPGSADEDPGTRFLIDVELPRLGHMQIDALAHPRRFDLILRSRVALPEPWRDGIAAIFEETRKIGRLEGDLAFVVAHDFVAPPIGAKSADARGVTA